MKPHIAQDVPEVVWQIFQTIKTIIETLPAMIETDMYVFKMKISRDTAVCRIIPSCHHITRALAAHLPVTVHDGRVTHIRRNGTAVNLQHSWLTVNGEDARWIIDPQPLGVVSGPALFVQGYAFDFQSVDTSGMIHPEDFQSVIAALSEAIREHLPK